MNTYTKLRDGSWGVRVEGRVSPGDSVTVRTKAGAEKTETVGRVVWSGQGVSICTTARSSAPRKERGRWNGCACGAREMPDGSLSANACAQCRFDHDDC